MMIPLLQNQSNFFHYTQCLHQDQEPHSFQIYLAIEQIKLVCQFFLSFLNSFLQLRIVRRYFLQITLHRGLADRLGIDFQQEVHATTQIQP